MGKKLAVMFISVFAIITGCEKDDFYGKDPQFYETNNNKTISLKRPYGFLPVYYGLKECSFTIKNNSIVGFIDYYLVNDKKWEIKLAPFRKGETMIYMNYNHKIIDSCKVTITE